MLVLVHAACEGYVGSQMAVQSMRADVQLPALATWQLSIHYSASDVVTGAHRRIIRLVAAPSWKLHTHQRK
jgi:hypothetical protein